MKFSLDLSSQNLETTYNLLQVLFFEEVVVNNRQYSSLGLWWSIGILSIGCYWQEPSFWESGVGNSPRR